MKAYRHDIRTFATLTRWLDFESKGIFVILLDQLMLTEKPIETQWVFLTLPKESRQKAMAVLERLFEKSGDGWILPSVASISMKEMP